MRYYYYTVEYRGMKFNVPATNEEEAKRFAIDFAIPKANATVDDIIIIDKILDPHCRG